MNNYNALLTTGYPIYIVTKEVQRRKHRKKRINKKWRKRYGVIESNLMPHGEILFADRAFYMTKKTYIEFNRTINERLFSEFDSHLKATMMKNANVNICIDGEWHKESEDNK